MEDELLKVGGRKKPGPQPGFKKAKQNSETVVHHDVEIEESTLGSLPYPDGMASLDEDNRRYAQQKTAEEYDIEALFQQYTTQQHQGILPNLPHDPTYSYCWVTTNKTFPDNNIARRMQGWHECSWEDVAHLGISSGNINTSRSAEIGEDLVSVQEMLLMRMPTLLRQRILKFNHHDEPTSKEENLYAQTRNALRGNRGQSVMLENESDSKTSLMGRKLKPNFNGV